MKRQFLKLFGLFVSMTLLILACKKEESMEVVNLVISKAEVNLEEGQKTTVKITAGSEKYTVESSDTSKVTVNVENNTITVNAVAEGEATVTIKDTKTKQTKTIQVTVTAKERYIELTTVKEVGETIKLIINAEEKDKADIWIDLNNNGTKDKGEAVTDFSSDFDNGGVEYTLGSQTIRIYGKVTVFLIHSSWNNEEEKSVGQEITSLNLLQNVELKQLWCESNQLTNLDLSKNKKLQFLVCSDNPLTSLDVSQNLELEGLGCKNIKLNNLDISKNKELKWLHCKNNQLSSLDVSKNIKLKFLECEDNNLSCIKVSQEQLAKTEDWNKDATASYNTNCE